MISPDEHGNDMMPSCDNATGDHDWQTRTSRDFCITCGCERRYDGAGCTTYVEGPEGYSANAMDDGDEDPDCDACGVCGATVATDGTRLAIHTADGARCDGSNTPRGAQS